MQSDPPTAANAAPIELPVLVIGAGPAGLAVSACLVQQGIRPEMIESGDSVAGSWRNHYRRLCLHTVKEHSALPHHPFPADAPRYVPREQVVDYLVDYATRFDLQPRFREEALSITRQAGGWLTRCRSGHVFSSRAVVLATGANHRPHAPQLPGQEVFRGRVSHSAAYRDAQAYAGQRVLVVGMGNTGAEIALDLAEQGARPTLSVRGPVNIVRRDMFGRPTQLTAIAISRLPPRVGDVVARVLRDLTVGDLRAWGIQTPAASPLRQLREEGRTPVIDVGTLARVKKGEIPVRPGIASLTSGGVRFQDGREEAFDAVILATGYHCLVAGLFPQEKIPVDAKGLPTLVSGEGALGGLYFAGYDTRQPGGLLRCIGQQASRIAEDIAARQPPVAESARAAPT